MDELVTDFPHIKKLHFESCDIKNLNLQKFENFEEIGLIYTMEHGEKLSDIIGNNWPKKLIISGDVVSLPENKEFVKKLRNSKIKVEIVGLKI